MTLSIGAMIQNSYCPDIIYWVSNEESAFELLTQLVTDGWVLLRATLIDESMRINLPIEAFDGQPMQAQVNQLLVHWQDMSLRSYLTQLADAVHLN